MSANWRVLTSSNMPPMNQWVDVVAYRGIKRINGTPYEGKARWYRKPNHEFLYWEIEDGTEYGAWYFDVEFWREMAAERDKQPVS